jgi:hypothetical protein
MHGDDCQIVTTKEIVESRSLIWWEIDFKSVCRYYFVDAAYAHDRVLSWPQG